MNNVKISIIFFLAITLVFAACSKKDNSSPNTARVNFTNACLNSTALDATIGGTRVSNATNLAFLKSSGYQNVAAGSATVGFVFNNTSQLVKDMSTTFTAQASYSAFVSGQITNPAVLVLSDDLTAPTSGMAKVRFINLSTDTLNEDVYIGSIKLGSAIHYAGYTSFSQVAAGSLIINVTDPANVPANIQLTQQFNSGKIYTIVLTGIQGGNSTAARTLTVINNN